jgi:hypothetical protein
VGKDGGNSPNQFLPLCSFVGASRGRGGINLTCRPFPYVFCFTCLLGLFVAASFFFGCRPVRTQ